MKIRLHYFGKPRDAHANALAADYLRRISHYAKADMTDLRAKLMRQGDADALKVEVERRDQEIARIHAEVNARSGENARLRSVLQQTEQGQDHAQPSGTF